MGCQLFRHMCEEKDLLAKTCQPYIVEAAHVMHDAEMKYIDKMFEAGDIEGLKSYDLKQFIKKETK